MPHGLRTARCGFTLIEVLVAVVILSTGIVLILSAYDSSLAALRSANDSMRAHLLLKEKLDSAELATFCGTSAGEFADIAGDYAWRMKVSTPIGHEDTTAREVVVTVWRKDGGREHTLATYVRKRNVHEEDEL